MMNQQDIFRKIGSILTELNEQYEFLAQNPDKLNDLEVELFLANANFLSDHVHIIQKLNTGKPENKLDAAVTIPPVDETKVEGDLFTEAKGEVTNEFKSAEINFSEEQELENLELEEVVAAEEADERIDIKPEQEIVDEEDIHEQTAETLLKKDFFKPDQDDHTFELILSNHDADDKFDYEEKSVEQIFDRPLSKEEEEILAHKKKIHDKEEAPVEVENEVSVVEEDEIGPEPFLIPTEQAEEIETPKIETPFVEEKTEEPVEELKNTIFDEPIISPVVEERPAFVPEAVPVKPVVQPIVEKSVPTLNDLLSKTNGQTEEVKAPIQDLKQAINLNEKLLFVKDLFGGYNMAYSEALDLVNRMNNFEAADSFLQKNYAAKNNWAAKQATVDQFYELLNRRFSS
ncbi:hypothetical protein [Pedobacter punctiformis]|uniref:Uncharacterized protein n=1 Tax=Pedobacter punctiformis TaxID=3004097 RepID=A0ABT4L9L5_9SPHI|nr:hypothetical protein [Pedobacter sp. HCMS5-2]MCZ4244598.1 hypothetical protein [Pedobacter sp. HCMS5-2]